MQQQPMRRPHDRPQQLRRMRQRLRLGRLRTRPLHEPQLRSVLVQELHLLRLRLPLRRRGRGRRSLHLRDHVVLVARVHQE